MSKTTLKTRPWCPFCGLDVGRPRYPDKRKLGEFAIGTCQCGAVYASDPTGFNIGAAMVDCLVHACGDNWDLAWELLPDEDYLTGLLEDYDEVTHQVVETRNLDGRIIKGILYFIRMQKDLAELAQRMREKSEADETAKPSQSKGRGIRVEPAPDPKRVRKKANKKIVREMVRNEDADGLVSLCFDDKKTLRLLQRLLYEPDEEKRWKTAKLIGEVCGRVATRKPGMVSDLLHLLFEACSDSASTNWGALESIGFIIAARPDIYGSFTRHLLNYMGDKSTMIPVLWALGTIAEERPDLVRNTSFYQLIGLLNSPETAVKGHMLRILGRLQAGEVATHISSMLKDRIPLTIYENGLPVQTDIGTLAAEAMEKIEKQGEN